MSIRAKKHFMAVIAIVISVFMLCGCTVTAPQQTENRKKVEDFWDTGMPKWFWHCGTDDIIYPDENGMYEFEGEKWRLRKNDNGTYTSVQEYSNGVPMYIEAPNGDNVPVNEDGTFRLPGMGYDYNFYFDWNGELQVNTYINGPSLNRYEEEKEARAKSLELIEAIEFLGIKVDELTYELVLQAVQSHTEWDSIINESEVERFLGTYEYNNIKDDLGIRTCHIDSIIETKIEEDTTCTHSINICMAEGKGKGDIYFEATERYEYESDVIYDVEEKCSIKYSHLSPRVLEGSLMPEEIDLSWFKKEDSEFFHVRDDFPMDFPLEDGIYYRDEEYCYWVVCNTEYDANVGQYIWLEWNWDKQLYESKTQW